MINKILYQYDVKLAIMFNSNCSNEFKITILIHFFITVYSDVLTVNCVNMLVSR